MPSVGQIHRLERGAVLPTVLVVLLVLTVLGMLAMSTAGVDVRLAANERDYQRALYAAEGGIAHMRALLHAKDTGTNWNYVFTDPDITAGIDSTLDGYRYRVTVYDRWDTIGTDIDNNSDNKILVCAEATSPVGTRASVEVMLSRGASSSGAGGGYAQAGAGVDKSSAGDDTEAVTDAVPTTLGGL